MHLDLACRPEEILTLTWLNVHPLRNDLGAPMWLDINKFRKGVVAPSTTTYHRTRGVADEGGWHQKEEGFSPYNFRHTGITMWAVLLTEQQLSKRTGTWLDRGA